MDLIPNGTPASLDGWTPFPSTWTYASATTFTVAGDVTAIFGVGTKLKWTQSSTVYYGYVASSSYSSPNTTVTVAGNPVLNATISNPYYSYASNPQGFPHWFSFTTTPGGFSANPTFTSAFCVCGRLVTVIIHPSAAGTSNDTILTLTVPINAARHARGIANGVDNGGYLSTMCLATLSAGSNTISVFPNSNLSSVWTNSGSKYVDLEITYSI